MKKQKSVLISAPVKSESGYGEKTREICAAIVDRYEDVKIDSLPWGKTPMSGLENDKYRYLSDYLLTGKLKEHPDYHIHIGLPMEFKPFGKKNILFTSGVEVSLIDINWILSLNKNCDAIIVPSNFVKNVIEGTTLQDNENKYYKVDKPVYVVNETYNEELLKPMSKQEEEGLNNVLSEIKESKWFLSCGQARTGIQNKSADRKNTYRLIKEFCTHFDGDTDVALVLKSNPANFSNLAYYELQKLINETLSEITTKNRPPVYLIKGFLNDRQLGGLVTHPNVVANISITHGEGFGRFLLESLVLGQRVVCPEIGGQADFIGYGNTLKLKGSFVQIPKEATLGGILPKESAWIEVDQKDLKKKFNHVLKNPMNEKTARKTSNKLKKEFGYERMKHEIYEILDLYQTEHVELELPENI